ncbi:hypothetical protein, partial [Klebsiella pneumoniae]|uniref:hypothetical protein n=1 Tax=Klebsiella pneumoniae TaxID=573 RepID=UPI003AAEBA0E
PHIPIGLGAHSTDWRISLAQGTESLGCHFALSRNRPHEGLKSHLKAPDKSKLEPLLNNLQKLKFPR